MFTNKLFLPCKELAPYISSISIMESSIPVSLKILPQPNAVMTLKYKGCMYFHQDGIINESATMNICGPYDNYKQRMLNRDTGFIVVKFREGGATGLFDFPIYEMFAATLSLESIFGAEEIKLIEEQLCLTWPHEEKIKVVEKFLCSRIRHHRKDDLILDATRQIRNAGGQLKIKTLCRDLYISESQFEKRFKKSVGTSAKKFSSLVRIAKVIATDRSHNNITERAYDAGYFDQAHFIRDFKSYTGLTPHQFFKLRSADAYSLMPICLIDTPMPHLA